LLYENVDDLYLPQQFWHYYLVITNMTTNESLNRKKYKYLRDVNGRFMNPYSAGLIANIMAFWRGQRHLLPEQKNDDEDIKLI